jgi:hypothetical protein
MSNKEKTREILEEMLSRFGNGDEVDDIIDDAITKLHPPEKPKEPEVIVHDLVGDEELDEEEWKLFNEDPEDFIHEMGLDVPSFSFGKDRQPTAYEGQELFVKLSGRLFKFQIFEGECIEASWSDTYYQTNYANVVEIPESEIGNYNLKKYSPW